MLFMNIAIIYGGRSGEHEVSLISAAAIARGVEKSNNIVLIGISKNGKWYLQDKSELERIKKDTKSPLIIQEKEENLVSVIPGKGKKSFVVNGNCLDVDVIFPALHGTYGEDGLVQGLLEMAELPYCGCDKKY